MKTIWYEPLIDALRLHIEECHMMEPGALEELKFAEEDMCYSQFGDDEKAKIVCPWSIHTKCQWEIEGHVEFSLVRIKGRGFVQQKLC